METNLTSRKRRLKSQIPDISSSLILINKLRAKRDANEDTDTNFLLSDSVYASAKIPATDKVNDNYRTQAIKHLGLDTSLQKSVQ